MEFRNTVVCKDYTEDPTGVKETVISEVNGRKFSKKEGVLDRLNVTKNSGKRKNFALQILMPLLVSLMRAAL